MLNSVSKIWLLSSGLCTTFTATPATRRRQPDTRIAWAEPQRPVLTTTAGAPVADNQNSLSADPRGPVLLQDWQLVEKLAHQNREPILERVVHAKGWGTDGTLTVTGDITRYTRAKFFSQVGRKPTSCNVFPPLPAPQMPSATCAGARAELAARRGTRAAAE